MAPRKKDKRVVVKLVRLTPEAHEKISSLSQIMGTTISDALIRAVDTAFPNLEAVKVDVENRKAEAIRRLGEKS